MTTATRYLHQCPGCWGYGLFAKPFSKRKGEGWIECKCGERMTRIDLRNQEPSPFGANPQEEREQP